MSVVTQWFDPSTPPVHAGVYELEDLPYPFHFWNGTAWQARANDYPDPALEAFDRGENLSRYIRESRWRGLADKP